MAQAKRISAGVERGPQVEIEVDGERITAFEGETIATTLLAAGKQNFRHTTKQNAPRGIFCGMGLCFDCVMTVNGVPNVRTCVTPVEGGMKIQTQDQSTWTGGR